MPQVQSIRRLRRNGESVASIARKTHVSEPTVRKYLAKEDLSAVPSVRKPRASVIDPYLPVIEQWLAEDRANWRKQRHTATRIWERLRDEHGAEVSLSTVTRAVARLRREFAAERDEAFMDLVWHPGEAQADFGEVDVLLRGVVQRMHHFVLDFPYSNVGLVQLMPGENTQGMDYSPQQLAADSGLGDTVPLACESNASYSLAHHPDIKFTATGSPDGRKALEVSAPGSARHALITVKPGTFDVSLHDERGIVSGESFPYEANDSWTYRLSGQALRGALDLAVGWADPQETSPETAGLDLALDDGMKTTHGR